MSHGAFIQMFVEFFPIVAFFIAGQVLPFSDAVAVLIGVTMLSLVVSWLSFRQLPLMALVSSVLVITSGSITLLYDRPDIIIFADTLYFFGLALCIAIGFSSQRHFLERVFDHTFAIKKEGWLILSRRWLILLIAAGIANEIVRITMTPEFWIDYKFTKVILIALFAFYQFRLSAHYRIQGESNTWGLRT